MSLLSNIEQRLTRIFVEPGKYDFSKYLLTDGAIPLEIPASVESMYYLAPNPDNTSFVTGIVVTKDRSHTMSALNIYREHSQLKVPESLYSSEEQGLKTFDALDNVVELCRLDALPLAFITVLEQTTETEQLRHLILCAHQLLRPSLALKTLVEAAFAARQQLYKNQIVQSSRQN
ncbi:hypothetical protein KBC79_04330 [Candidatus Woesebacteria bacterium]|nr:hypothetical protein [Candidatus Woesebacteria bacterium]